MENINYTDLDTKGFLVIKNFFNADTIEQLTDYYKLAFAKNQALGNDNKNHNIIKVSAQAIAITTPLLTSLVEAINQNTDIKIDKLPVATYINSALASHNWHQDHEIYYTWQTAVNSLNFWFPLIKQDPTQTGISLIPHDALQEKCPDLFAQHIVGKGAKRIEPGRYGYSTICDDETGEEYSVSFDLNDLAVSPEVAVGDLIILRADVFHKTQDTDTPRVAMSVRGVNSNTVVRKDVFYSGCDKKRTMIQNNLKSYQPLIDQFAITDECSISVIHP